MSLGLDREFIQTWSKQELSNGKGFDDLFTIDNIPLFWFHKRYFLKHVLPRPLNTYAELEGGRKINFLRKLYLQWSAMVLRKYLLFNEIKKIKSSGRISALQRECAEAGHTARKKALFLTYFDHLREGGSLYRTQGIIDKLQKDKVLEPFTLFVAQLSTKTNPIRKSRVIREAKTIEEGSGLNTLYQYYDPYLDFKAKEKADYFFKEWEKLDWADLNRAMTLKEQQWWPYLFPAFSLFMSKEFLYLTILYYELCKKVIEKERIAILILTTQSGLLDRCMIAASKTKGIPCMMVPHGFAAKYFTTDNIFDNMYFPLFDQTTRDIFIRRGVSADQVRVTGPAIYDNILKYGGHKGRKEPSSTKNILLLTQPLIEDNQITASEYFNLIKRIVAEITCLNGVSITIKLHPRERGIRQYRKLARGFAATRISIQQQGNNDLLYSLLEKADVVVNFNATAAILEASILDKPSITFPLNKKRSLNYGDFDPSVYVWDLKSLNPTIENLLGNPSLLRQKRQVMVQEFCSVVDGKASERIAQWCYEILNKK